jgi:hypothetical protein
MRVMAAPEHIIQCDSEVFKRTFNRVPHEVRHTLAANPLFELPAVAQLAEQVAARKNPHYTQGDAYFDMGASDEKAGSAASGRSPANMGKLIEEIGKGQTWVILKHIEREPGYREVFENCVCDIVDLAGIKIVNRIKWFEAILFVTSPNRVTDYHIDRECSWLLQIHGDKDIHLFDRADKDILSDRELEHYWMFNKTFSAVYRPQYESRAMVYRLQPGIGVHSPVNTPHWLQNGNNVSVSLNINFQFHPHEWENLFKANYHLRRAGFAPAPFGKYPLADQLKRGVFTAFQGLKSSVKGRRGASHPETRQQSRRVIDMLASR